MADWKHRRAGQYPRLSKIVKLMTEVELLDSGERMFLNRLEELANELFLQGVRPTRIEEEERPIPKKPPSSRRTKNVRNRIKTGLTHFLIKGWKLSIEKGCKKYKLVSVNTYYAYQREGLIYTEADIIALGATWYDLEEVLLREEKAELERRIGKLTLKNKRI